MTSLATAIGGLRPPTIRRSRRDGRRDPVSQLHEADAVHRWLYDEIALTTLVGLVDSPVARVSVELANGAQLDATVRDSMFVAWRPSSTAFTRASAQDAAGTVLGGDGSGQTAGFETTFEDGP